MPNTLKPGDDIGHIAGLSVEAVGDLKQIGITTVGNLVDGLEELLSSRELRPKVRENIRAVFDDDWNIFPTTGENAV